MSLRLNRVILKIYLHKVRSYFNKAIEINPKFAEAYNNRGLAYYIKGQHDKAISDCTKAKEIEIINRGNN